jgi:hypothetical protein
MKSWSRIDNERSDCTRVDCASGKTNCS